MLNLKIPHFYIAYTNYTVRSRDSSVSIVSDYGLDDRAIAVLSPAEAKDFSSNLCVQADNGYRGSFPRGKARPGRDADH
jgi:hypothetical protein